MQSVSVSTEVIYPRNESHRTISKEYKVDMLREVKKRWTVLGVLFVVMLAIIGPRVGAPGGPLHTEYLSHLPLWYIYYTAGRAHTQTHGRWPHTAAVTCAHAHIIAPALCVVLVTMCRDGVDYRIVKGALLSSIGGGCAWASLALSPRAGGAALSAANYAASLVATPLAMLVLCGRATVPPLWGVLSSLLSSVPFGLGLLRPRRQQCTVSKLSALFLLYADCCERLREAEGILYVSDVLVTMTMAVMWLAMSACACGLYARCGLVTSRAARAVAAAAVPKALDLGWEISSSCSGSGLSRLSAVFVAPAQALLLAALGGDDDDDDGGGGGGDDTGGETA